MPLKSPPTITEENADVAQQSVSEPDITQPEKEIDTPVVELEPETRSAGVTTAEPWEWKYYVLPILLVLPLLGLVWRQRNRRALQRVRSRQNTLGGHGAPVRRHDAFAGHLNSRPSAADPYFHLHAEAKCWDRQPYEVFAYEEELVVWLVEERELG